MDVVEIEGGVDISGLVSKRIRFIDLGGRSRSAVLEVQDLIDIRGFNRRSSIFDDVALMDGLGGRSRFEVNGLIDKAFFTIKRVRVEFRVSESGIPCSTSKVGILKRRFFPWHKAEFAMSPGLRTLHRGE